MATAEISLKWKRLAPGKYAAATPCGHTVIVERWGRGYGWVMYFDGGYRIACREWPTLKGAKDSAPSNLELLRLGWDERQAKEAAKVKAETDKLVAEKITACRLRDSKSPPAGVPWHEWAERFVGCTGKDIFKANIGPTLAEVLDDWLVEHCQDEAYPLIAADLEKWFGDTYATPLTQALEENKLE